MNLRRLPAILLFGLAVLAAPAAVAQPAPTPEEVQQAQARWNEGKAAFDAGNFEAARVAFKQAYTVFAHPAFLQNLGEAELRTGRYVEAARHLSEFLRQATQIPPAQKELATKSLKRAAERLGAVVVEADVADAEVRVDGDVVGKTPLGGAPYYVEPGTHVVVLRKEGFVDATQSVDVLKGPPKSVALSMRPVESGAPAQPPLAPAVASEAAPSPPSTPIETRTYVLVGGATLTVVAVVVGTVFAVKVGSDSNRWNEINDGLNAIKPADWSGCVYKPPDPNAKPPTPAYVPDAGQCADLADANQTRQSHQNIRNASFIAAGVLGAATVATYLLWPRSQPTVTVMPHVGPGLAGIGVTGAF
jgi:hypothetical protein